MRVTIRIGINFLPLLWTTGHCSLGCTETKPHRSLKFTCGHNKLERQQFAVRGFRFITRTDYHKVVNVTEQSTQLSKEAKIFPRCIHYSPLKNILATGIQSHKNIDPIGAVLIHPKGEKRNVVHKKMLMATLSIIVKGRGSMGGSNQPKQGVLI